MIDINILLPERPQKGLAAGYVADLLVPDEPEQPQVTSG